MVLWLRSVENYKHPNALFCTTQRCESVYVVVPEGSSSRAGDDVVYVKDIKQPTLPTPFYFVLVSISVFMALSTVFHSINSSDNSPLSHSVLLVLIPPDWSFQLYIFMKVSLSPDMILCG